MIHVQTLTSHMQFPVDVQELQTPPLATRHRRVMSRRVPGDTTESNTEKSKKHLCLPKVLYFKLKELTKVFLDTIFPISKFVS